MNRLVPSLILFCVISCIATEAAASIMFSDGIFNDADWEILTITSGNGGASSSTQVATGGVPDFYRRTSITTNAAPGPLWRSRVTIVHLLDGATYNPSTQGAITSISYREDAIWLSGPSGSGMRTGVALRQGSRVYIVHLGEPVTGTETNWHAETATWLESDFNELNGDLVNGFDEASLPNFTNGGPIKFGFFRTTNTGPGTSGGGPFVTGIDNWQMTINTAEAVPVPGSLILWAVGCLSVVLGRSLCSWRAA